MCATSLPAALAALLVVAASPPAAPPEPKELAAIRDRYQAATAVLAEGSTHKIEINPPSSERATRALKLVGDDHLDGEGDGRRLVLVRSEDRWSNLGVHTREFLYDEGGELVFYYLSGNMGGGEWKQLRLYFAKGALIWVVDGKKAQPPGAAHKPQAEAAQKEAKRLQAAWRELTGS